MDPVREILPQNSSRPKLPIIQVKLNLNDIETLILMFDDFGIVKVQLPKKKNHFKNSRYNVETSGEKLNFIEEIRLHS